MPVTSRQQVQYAILKKFFSSLSCFGIHSTRFIFLCMQKKSHFLVEMAYFQQSIQTANCNTFKRVWHFKKHIKQLGTLLGFGVKVININKKHCRKAKNMFKTNNKNTNSRWQTSTNTPLVFLLITRFFLLTLRM